MLIEYLPILLLIVIALLFAGGALLLSSIMGPRRVTPVKLEPYECGIPAVGLARDRFSIKFYLVAMLFIIFDIEIIFLFPWAVIFQELGWFGFLEMGGFVLVLGLGLAYVWRKGGLEWSDFEYRPEGPGMEASGKESGVSLK